MRCCAPPTARAAGSRPTALYKQIYEAAGDLKPINISVDTLTRAFAGNEIDRVQVYGFAMHMQALAMVARRLGDDPEPSEPRAAWRPARDCRARPRGTARSASACISRAAKADEGEQPDDDLREFEFKKNQYGPRGQSMVLRYRGGLFLPEGGQLAAGKARPRIVGGSGVHGAAAAVRRSGAERQRQENLPELRARRRSPGRPRPKEYTAAVEARFRAGHAAAVRRRAGSGSSTTASHRVQRRALS